MTVIAHDGIIHIAYEGAYPWDDGALEKAKAGLDSWIMFQAPRPEADEDMLIGTLVSDWDFASGKFLGTRPKPPEPTESEKLVLEMHELKTLMSSSDWYVARQAKTGIPIPAEVLSQYQEAREKYDILELKLKSLEDTHVD